MQNRSENIYEQYCNDFQNPALGAYLITKFVESFYKNADSNKLLNILYLFSIMPLVMNVNFRNCIRKKLILNSLVTAINESEKLFGSYQEAIDKYKEYTLCSLIFAIRLGFVSVNENAIVKLEINELPRHTNVIIKNAEQLGKLFGNGDLYSFLAMLGVSL